MSDTKKSYSNIYTGTLAHTRFEPVYHHFRYPAYIMAIDLDDVEDLSKSNRFLSFNKFNFYSIWNNDFFDRSDTALKQKCLNLIESHYNKKPPVDMSRIILVTVPRFLNYVFNPISLFYCYDASEQLKIVIAQVNNTFKESHLYILDTPRTTKQNHSLWNCSKTFHVSPFFDVKGNYEFNLADIKDELSIQITYKRDEKKSLHASLKGEGKKIKNMSLMMTWLKYPLTATFTIPRIVYQAFILRFLKKLKVFKKPITGDSMTIRKQQASLLQRLYIKLIINSFQKIRKGHLVLELPEKKRIHFGDQNEKAIIMYIHDYAFFTKLVYGSDIGLGESYVDGLWSTDDLNTCLECFVNNKSYFKEDIPIFSALKNILHKRQHKKRKNSKRKSKKNIAYHYDISNALYGLFLDRNLLYSCALFMHQDEPLEKAQEAKMERLIEKADISSDHHVLEIGTGWGSFASYLAKTKKCKVTSVTISKEQYRYAKEKIKTEGLEKHVTILLKDYRDIKGRFDRIVSIEMIEAVGYSYLPKFFKTCNHLLTEKGKLVLQAITMPDDRYKAYSKSCDWIQKHIFPGGHLPSLSHIRSLIDTHTELTISDLTRITPHYKKTLELWRKNFLEKKDTILSLGFNDSFIRKWIYYFCYCEIGFKAELIDNFHIVFDKDSEKKETSFPEIKSLPLHFAKKAISS